MIIFKMFKWLFILVFCFLLGRSLWGTFERNFLMTPQQLQERIEWRKQRIKELERQTFIDWELEKKEKGGRK